MILNSHIVISYLCNLDLLMAIPGPILLCVYAGQCVSKVPYVWTHATFINHKTTPWQRRRGGGRACVILFVSEFPRAAVEYVRKKSLIFSISIAKKCSASEMADGASRNAKEKLAKLKTEEQVVLKSCKASLNAIKLCDQQLASDVAIVAGELENTRYAFNCDFIANLFV